MEFWWLDRLHGLAIMHLLHLVRDVMRLSVQPVITPSAIQQGSRAACDAGPGGEERLQREAGGARERINDLTCSLRLRVTSK